MLEARAATEACRDRHGLVDLRLKGGSGTLVTGGPPEAGRRDEQKRECSGGAQAGQPTGGQVRSWSPGQRRGLEVQLWGSGMAVRTDAL